MDHQTQLTNYIQQHLQAGTPPDTIRTTLLQAGWHAEMVDQALQDILGQQPSQSAELPDAAPNTETAPTQQYTYQETATTSTQPTEQQPQQTQPAVAAVADAPVKYKIFRAVSDTIRAIRNNFPPYLGLTVSSYLISGALYVPLTIGATLLAASLFAESSTLILLAFIIPTLLSLAGLVIVSAFIIAATSMAVADGAEGRKTSFFTTLVKAFKVVPRILGANLLVFAVSIAPIILLTALAFALGGAGGGALMNIILILGGLGSMAWILIAMLRYALAPYVALFEPDVPVTQTLKRSKALLIGGGQWFIVKGILLIFLVAIILGAFTGKPVTEVESSSNPIVIIILILLNVLVEGALVMLYLNRKAVKAAQQQ